MAKIKIKPLADRVLVEPAAAEEKLQEELSFPIQQRKNPRKVHCSCWSGEKDEPMTVKPGDSVLYGKYAGTEITIDGTNYLIMRESDIVAVV